MNLKKLGTLLILWIPCFSSSGPVGPAAASSAKPNVLFIMVDDLRPELGCYGSPVVQSPNIDRLAAQGILFTRAYCQQAVCNPSRASLLTGLRPDTIKVWDLQTHFRKNRPDIITLPQIFRGNGYTTLGLGKIFHDTLPDPPSWSRTAPDNPVKYHYLATPTRGRLWERAAAAKRLGKTRAWIASFLRGPATESVKAHDNQYRDGAMTDTAVRLLKELKREQPFFLAVGYHKPHLPFVAPKKYWDLYQREELPLAANHFLPKSAPPFAMNRMRELAAYEDFVRAPRPTEGSLTDEQARLLRHGYYACVSYIDAQIGRLLDALERQNLSRSTIVVLLSDHGWKLGEHNSWGKQTNYENDTLSPLILSIPGISGNGRSCPALVEYVDLYPTLCEAVGFPLPSSLEGISLLPLLKDPSRPWKNAVFNQYQRGFMGRFMGRSIRTLRYRYVEWRDRFDNTFVDAELYDHHSDPQENINIAPLSRSQEILQELSRRLWQGWWAARPPILNPERK